MTVVLVVAIVCAAVWFLRLASGPERLARELRAGIGGSERVETVVYSAFEELQVDPKLVVMTATVAVTQTRQAERRILWDQVNLGTNQVTLTKAGNRVQYVLPLGDLGPKHLRWHADRRELVVRIPAPVVDEAIVEVQSDPDKEAVSRERGWARSPASLTETEAVLRRDLRRRVIAAGRNPMLLQQAHRHAEDVVRELFQGILEARGLENATVRPCIN